jgi:hypothetical protein
MRGVDELELTVLLKRLANSQLCEVEVVNEMMPVLLVEMLICCAVVPGELSDTEETDDVNVVLPPVPLVPLLYVTVMVACGTPGVEAINGIVAV